MDFLVARLFLFGKQTNNKKGQNTMTRQQAMSHKQCKDWTIKVTYEGIEFFITDIVFQDIALAAAEGIKRAHPNYLVHVYFATVSVGGAK